MKTKKTIGILGGMGPAATSKLFEYVIAATPATKDQDHIPVIVVNNPQIPDRTAALIANGESPVPALIGGVQKLQQVGADFFIMPCNTAHAFLPQVLEKVSIPCLSMLEVTAEYIRSKGHTKIGLLATDGTLASRVYHNALGNSIEVITPDTATQKQVMKIIYEGVKKDLSQDWIRPEFDELIQSMLSHGAEVIILGCTELPLIVYDKNICIDPMKNLAQAAVDFAFKD